MGLVDEQTPINISGVNFPEFTSEKGKSPERFWFIKDQFVSHSKSLLTDGNIFTNISSHFSEGRWICNNSPIDKADIAHFVLRLRLFYMKSEYMSIFSFCSYMLRHVDNRYVSRFF